MLYISYDAGYPVEYLSSGNLVSKDGFLHSRRNIDSFVFILVCQGTLHICQNNRQYDVGENEAIILFANTVHYGYKPSQGPLSYYWTHFYVTDPGYRIYNQQALLRHNAFLQSNRERLMPEQQEEPGESGEKFILPEYCHLPKERRSQLLFAQLLDMSKRDNYRRTWRSRYAQNLLLAEYYAEYMETGALSMITYPNVVKQVIEWIRTHFDEQLTLNGLAEQFGYNPTYLTSLLKKHTGKTVNQLLNYYRINAAKNRLCTESTPSIKRVALACGFQDEKYFMRVFRQLEGVTPAKYRDAFHDKKVVTK